jgi:hypothetical protein
MPNELLCPLTSLAGSRMFLPSPPLVPFSDSMSNEFRLSAIASFTLPSYMYDIEMLTVPYECEQSSPPLLQRPRKRKK